MAKPPHAAVVERTVALSKERPELLRALFPASGDYTDAVQASGARARPQRVHGDAASMLLHHMVHVPVNPSRKENSYILERAYVFADAASAQDAAHEVVNRTPEASNAFLERVVAVARSERDRSLPQEPPIAGRAARPVRNGDRFFSLIGPRGSGKTFYLNHLFTAHARSLEDRKVIWVRVNLISDRGFDADLPGWIHAQIAKILLRYHDPRSGFLTRGSGAAYPFCEAVESWIASLPPEERARRLAGWEKMRTIFVEPGSDHDISPENVDEIIAMQIFRIARVAGWAFVIVLDGFDRLDHDRNNTSRFKTISDQLRTFMAGNAAFGAAFIVVTRSETFAWLSAHPTWVRMDDRSFEVGAANLFDIVDKRMVVLSDWDGADARGGSVATLALDFRDHLLTEHGKGQLSELDLTLTENIRAKLQMVELIFQEYYQKTSHQGYRVVEFLVKAGFNYPPLLYDHRLEDDQIHSVINESTSYDSRFLPILTRPPVPMSHGRRDMSRYHYGSPLHAFRLLQLATALPASDIQIDDLLTVLQRWFGYDAAVSRALIYDLESYELLAVLRARDTFEDADTDALRVTKKGMFALELGFTDPAYLNLCGMRTLLGRSTFRAPGLFEAATLTTRGDYRKHLHEWLRVKIKNAAAMAILLTAINAEQERAFRPAPPRRPYGFEADLLSAGVDRRIFQPIKHLAERVASGLTAISAGDIVRRNQLEEIFSNLEDHIATLENG